MISTRSLAGACALAALAGCSAVGPDYRAPVATSPADWAEWHGGDPALAPRTASSPASTASAPTAASRWALLQDATLDTLEARASQANTDLRLAVLRLGEARASARMVGSQAGPQVDFTGGLARDRLSDSGASTRMVQALGTPVQQAALLKYLSTPYTLYQAGFDASWELDLWGRVRRSVESAEAQRGQAQALLAQAGWVVRAEVARDYVLLRSQQRQLQTLQDERNAAREQLRLLAVRARDGVDDDLGRLQASQGVAALDARIDDQDATIAASIDRLTLLCGERPGALNELLVARPEQALATPPLPDLGQPSDFLRHRPDVAAAERRLAAATADIGVAVADLYPRIALGAGVGFESVHGSDFGDWGSRQWSVGPSLSVPVFDQGRRRATIELRNLQQQEAAVAFQQAVLQAWHDVDGAVTAYAAARGGLAAATRRRVDAESMLDLARARENRGLTDDLPVLQALQAVAQARSSEAQAAGTAAMQQVAVVKALGDDPGADGSMP